MKYIIYIYIKIKKTVNCVQDTSRKWYAVFRGIPRLPQHTFFRDIFGRYFSYFFKLFFFQKLLFLSAKNKQRSAAETRFADCIWKAAVQIYGVAESYVINVSFSTVPGTYYTGNGRLRYQYAFLLLTILSVDDGYSYYELMLV